MLGTDEGNRGGECASNFQNAADFKLGEMYSKKNYETDSPNYNECRETIRIIAFINVPVPTFSYFGDTNFQYLEVLYFKYMLNPLSS